MIVGHPLRVALYFAAISWMSLLGSRLGLTLLSQVQLVADREILGWVTVATAAIMGFLFALALSIVLARQGARRILAITQSVRELTDGIPDQPSRTPDGEVLSTLVRAVDRLRAKVRSDARAMEDERDRFETVLSQMVDGVVIADATETIRLVNPAAARLLGKAQDHMVNRSLMTMVRDHELVALARTALSSDATTHHIQVIELVMPGQRHTVQAIASRIGERRGEGDGVLLLLHDVTEFARSQATRREFVANVSHELRTPIAALKALVETLEGGTIEEVDVARDFLGRMHREVDGLAQLIEEILELSRIETGRTPPRLDPCDLGKAIADGIERLRPLAERNGVGLNVDLPDDLTAVHADPDQIRHVVMNLVHNAVKFTPPGGWVTVSAARQAGDVAVAVADSGIGIAAEALPHIFDRFYKADRTRAGKGTGLGLAIVKQIVQAHGGRIWAESAGEGQGATFTFVLPVDLPLRKP